MLSEVFACFESTFFSFYGDVSEGGYLNAGRLLQKRNLQRAWDGTKTEPMLCSHTQALFHPGG